MDSQARPQGSEEAASSVKQHSDLENSLSKDSDQDSVHKIERKYRHLDALKEIDTFALLRNRQRWMTDEIEVLGKERDKLEWQRLKRDKIKDRALKSIKNTTSLLAPIRPGLDTDGVTHFAIQDERNTTLHLEQARIENEQVELEKRIKTLDDNSARVMAMTTKTEILSCHFDRAASNFVRREDYRHLTLLLAAARELSEFLDSDRYRSCYNVMLELHTLRPYEHDVQRGIEQIFVAELRIIILACETLISYR